MSGKEAGWTERFAGLRRLSPQLRRKLENAARIRRFRAGDRIFGPGHTPSGMLFLLEGTVRVAQQSDSGREIVLYRVSAGESCVMTSACLFTQHNYFAEGIAESDVVAAEVPKSTFEELLADAPEFRDFVFSAYANRIVDLFRVIDDVVFGRMDLRIAERLVQLANADGEVRLTQAELAAELGTAREVVSRQLGEFQRRGWVELGRGRTRLIDPDALARFAASG
ncbi:CRP/FNR family transcriptional regulator, anaerobic regulatory protein [Meinhardsimonia xiamenensis]|jgi:CRP/FNR family transcriptional regulator|uniref:CRP/FNR family transcriptional regulator, anaerobic regulatory protein n=1 Tax=Meinhardsimonia xiamenensis TaxID=990712 RepID=A0A1G9D3P9_9RHOB|nr:Crp/Fnr family transcriptional regulator [Meinhardsimonia xiamenensis]PRX38143.1 CRP/FNR family transcriptional regulator [Meinhardsimonia xiamenensis]SDK58497.1 CRP/FNR family transcriptional regulator, anaerobic regulatory protein [Meinhardsimonia xiamenensis]